MPVTSFEAEALFTIRIIKHHNLNPDRHFSNTYELRATAGGDEGDLLDAGLRLVEFERAMSVTTTVFDRLLISTWGEDSVPYDPAVFISSSLTVNGTRTIGGDVQPLTTVLSIARVCATGRFGHLFLRNALLESDTQSPAGKAVLVDRPTTQGQLDLAITTSDISDYLGMAPTGSMGMVLVSADGSSVRAVVGLGVVGVTQMPVDHAWYNRSSSVAP